MRLGSEDNLPEGSSPDDVYNSSYKFSTYEQVNALPPTRGERAAMLPPAYIATEAFADTFNAESVVVAVGDESCSKSEPHCNGKLVPGTFYSAFLRAFPLSTINRQQPITVVFVSSDFSPVVQTVSSPSPGARTSNSATQSIIIGVVVGVVLTLLVAIVFVLVALFVLFMRRRPVSSSLPPPEEEKHPTSGSEQPTSGSETASQTSRDDVVSPHSDNLAVLPTFPPDSTDSATSSPDFPDAAPPHLNTDLTECYPKTLELKTLELKTLELELKPVERKRVELSDPVPSHNFSSHVELCDADEQELFKGEFDVRVWLPGGCG